jgi:hypothetical protein
MLGLRGCIFANEPSEEQPAIIYYRPYNSVLSGGEWVKILPEGIHVICKYIDYVRKNAILMDEQI